MKLHRLDAQNWTEYFNDATQNMICQDPDMILSTNPVLELYLVQYGSDQKMNRLANSLKGCSLQEAVMEGHNPEKERHYAKVVLHHALNRENLSLEEGALYNYSPSQEQKDVSIFFEKEDGSCLYFSQTFLDYLKDKRWDDVRLLSL